MKDKVAISINSVLDVKCFWGEISRDMFGLEKSFLDLNISKKYISPDKHILIASPDFDYNKIIEIVGDEQTEKCFLREKNDYFFVVSNKARGDNNILPEERLLLKLYILALGIDQGLVDNMKILFRSENVNDVACAPSINFSHWNQPEFSRRHYKRSFF